MPGPIRKRDAERRRRNKDETETISVDLDNLIAGEVQIPAPPLRWVADEKIDPDDEDAVINDEGEIGRMVSSWHRTALDAYWSLSKSGQAIFMEPSDLSTAYLLCEMISRELKPKPMLTTDAEGATSIDWVIQPVNGAVMNAFLKGWASLMATEGDRRKLRIELDRKKQRDAAASGGNVASISQKRGERFAQASVGPS